MCGIVGIFDIREKRGINRDLLSRMNESQYHRGPDEGGLHIEAGLGFGHRRLSIIDLTSGQQPMVSRDKNAILTFNGEIYNFLELRKELEGLGFVFQTHCDTEVILYGWQAWGESCVDRLRGMFAFAVWDRDQQTLFLARDRLGVKPLYYAELANGQFIFGSELKSLKEHPELPKIFDPTAIEDYFGFGYVPDP
ncbi:MAG: asparagine synthetase B, partial [Methylococcaceae bacterium]|nr:asparagine synthetase B [Methylococcaceae bacterium]